MKIARIILSEHPKEQDLDLFLDGHREAVEKGFLSIANFSVAVQTGPKSQLTFTVYENEETATEAKEKAGQFFKAQADHIYEIIDFHGPVME